MHTVLLFKQEVIWIILNLNSNFCDPYTPLQLRSMQGYLYITGFLDQVSDWPILSQVTVAKWEIKNLGRIKLKGE